MRTSVSRIVRGIGAGAVLGTLAFFVLSKDARHRLQMAARAFRDPALVEANAAPAGISEPIRVFETPTELQLAGDFSPLPDDIDDDDASFLKTLVVPDLHVPVTRRTIRYVRLFAKTESGRQSFLARYRRAGAYREIVERALRESGLPEDLVWIPAIESGFDPRAVSPKGAAGLWQFMPETGATYGLYQSRFVDERMSPIRSSQAAVSHLRDLYERFGRWDLALAAYNLGYEGVVRSMERYLASPAAQGRRLGAPVELSELSEAKVIPDETANYVPQIMAFAIVAANRSRFGLDVTSLAPADPLEFAEISVPEGTRLRTVARAAGMSTSSLRDYNPHLLRDRVPPRGGDFILYVPADRVQRTIVSFPAFQDHEVLIDDEGVEMMDDLPRDPLAGPAPSRPRNRLPLFVVPGQDPGHLVGPPVLFSSFKAKLPAMTVGEFRRAMVDDPLSLLSPGAPSPKSREVALGFNPADLGPKPLDPLAPSDSFTLPSGVTIEIVQNRAAAMVAITTRIAPAGVTTSLVGVPGVTPSEVRNTLTVPTRSFEAGMDVAVRKLRLTLAETESGAPLRRAASAPYRHDLLAAPGGDAWVALSDALFPKGHPLEGAIVTGRADTGLYCDLFLAEEMRKERAPRRATLTVAGNISRSRVQKALETAFFTAGSADQSVGQHPIEERVAVTSATAHRVLYGWMGPAEGEPGHAAMRVTIEILAGKKGGRLKKSLLDEEKVISEISGVVEPNPRAAVAAIDVVPLKDSAVVDIDRRLEAELADLAEKGPTFAEVALAKALIAARIEREKRSVEPVQSGKTIRTLAPGAVPIASRTLLDPTAYDRLLAQLNEVAIVSVKLAAARLFAKEHRVSVVVGPEKKPAEPGDL